MRRGDVIFYGPGGSQHVTLYLGNGQMLEAPYTGFGGEGLAGAHQRHDPVRRPLHRILIAGDILRNRLFRWLQLLLLVIAAAALSLGAALSSSPLGYAAPDDGQWDPTLPKMLSAGAPGDPVAIANASLSGDRSWPFRPPRIWASSSCSSLGLGGPSTGSVDRRCARARPPGDRVRDPARRLADGRAVFMGRRHCRTVPARASTPAQARSASTARV